MSAIPDTTPKLYSIRLTEAQKALFGCGEWIAATEGIKVVDGVPCFEVVYQYNDYRENVPLEDWQLAKYAYIPVIE